MRRRWGRVGAALAVAAVVVAGCSADEQAAAPPGTAAGAPPGTTPAAIEIVRDTAWPMHPIDGRFRGANGLAATDVDGDGRTDYATNYEFDQRWELALHPGDGADVRAGWPTVEIWSPDPLVEGNGKNPESVALGDFDGDGNVDAAGAHGFSDVLAFEGSAPGIHVVWGPERDQVTDEDAWIDAGWVPATLDLGHPHWADAHDVDGDGLTDIVFGGRRHGGGGGYDSPDSPNGNGSFTGLGWLEAPADPAARRDLSRWVVHHIDADAPSGHGFVFADLDGDGDDDIADGDADFDTLEEQESVVWYENPGPGTDAQRDEWPKTVLLTSPDFYAKPSVAAGDLDGDGDRDLATQTDGELILFRNDGQADPTFETVRLPKPASVAWRSRAVRVADVDADGRQDLIGMLIHADGALPADRPSVYWLRNVGDPFTEAGWELHPISWGSGTTMRVPGFGEKWDMADVRDVDGDGDLDVVANCEEWWAEPQGEVAWFFTPGLATSSVAVVWFENRMGEPAAPVEQVGDEVVLEAERPTTIGDSTWVERAPVQGDATATPAVQAFNGLAIPGEGFLAADASDGLEYDVAVDGGRYVVWARVFQPSAFSADVGADGADSAWLVVDGGEPLVVGDEPGGASDTWAWVRVGEVDLAAGTATVALRVREHGVAVDRILLTTDAATVPG